ncbi:Cof-type HAD-IIB family hydrolase [Trabulsiella odontotermitis]|uniref:Cof-type HAD-IIB family hydrolase n=1 Tax=Trabulsiella odontotermitis TaxID=379893 RepID=UPI0006767186|nr:Cof-type HAD-IIB family hydrolase [Trabulsiella odontotermitis]KNC92121.1 sugar phosphatase [Trabulsiella odontotermitis]
MSVKLIAVDMDGTFLNDAKTYNRARFQQQYQRMKQQGIRFVVASGNQYYQLKSFFPEIASEIAFVAENGGWGGDEVVRYLQTRSEIEIIACGKNSAYTLREYDDAFVTMAARYYHRLERVDDFSNIDDTFLKFGLNIDDSLVPEMQALLHEELGDIMTAVTTGHGSIDLIVPGIHKANGLRLLQAQWGIEDKDVLAFGDSGNDLEMLRQAGYGFAMANASPAVKAVARFEAPHNNDEGVLAIIEKALNQDTPFR